MMDKDKEKLCLRKITSVLQASLVLLMNGMVLSSIYFEKVEKTLKNVSEELKNSVYSVSFFWSDIYDLQEKHVIFNWGFLVFVVLVIVLLYFSTLFKEEAEEETRSASYVDVGEGKSEQQESRTADSD